MVPTVVARRVPHAVAVANLRVAVATAVAPAADVLLDVAAVVVAADANQHAVAKAAVAVA